MALQTRHETRHPTDPQPQPEPEPDPQPEPQPAPVLGLHPDIGQWHGQPATPAKSDVPGYWMRNPENGMLSKIVDDDTLQRCIREGFVMSPDPTITPGIPIFGQPLKKLNQLGMGASVSVQRTN